MTKEEEVDLRIAAETARQIEDIAHCPADKIIAGFLYRRALNKIREQKFPTPKEL